jgi:hypothetical protein
MAEEQPMAVVIQFRHDEAAVWTAENPILAEGEVGVELDTDLFKIGDGVTAWNDKAYAQRGLKGNKGDTGLTGATGAASTVPGPKGDKGDKGDQGDKGNTGAAGLDGYTPIKGIDYIDGQKGDTGDKGDKGDQGDASTIPGPQGDQGPTGADGKTVLNGAGAPQSGNGVDGDFYIDTTNADIYGPKAGGAWGFGTSLIGPQGSKGDTGDTGAGGKTVLNGSGVPILGLGVDGDFYIDTTGDAIYGPKTSGAWGSATSLVGPQGETGPAGADGADSIVPGPKGDKGDTGSVAGSFGVSIDGGGSVIAAGVKQPIVMPFACTITGWHLVGSPQGTVVMDVWKKAGATPTLADSITGSEKPSLSGSEVNSDTTLSTWTTNVAAGDVIVFNVDSCVACKMLTLSIAVTK